MTIQKENELKTLFDTAYYSLLFVEELKSILDSGKIVFEHDKDVIYNLLWKYNLAFRYVEFEV